MKRYYLTKESKAFDIETGEDAEINGKWVKHEPWMDEVEKVTRQNESLTIRMKALHDAYLKTITAITSKESTNV
jgi:hypothetical protein